MTAGIFNPYDVKKKVEAPEEPATVQFGTNRQVIFHKILPSKTLDHICELLLDCIPKHGYRLQRLGIYKDAPPEGITGIVKIAGAGTDFYIHCTGESDVERDASALQRIAFALHTLNVRDILNKHNVTLIVR